MKSIVVAAAATAALLALPGLAQAQDAAMNLYGTIGYEALDPDEGDLGAIEGRVGARVGRYFGVEAEAAFGVKDQSVDTGLLPPAPATVDVSLKHEIGAFGVVFLPATENFDVFARAGYTSIELEGSTSGVSASTDFDGWAYGVGAQYFFDGVNGVRVDYTRHEFDDAGALDTWAVAYSRRF